MANQTFAVGPYRQVIDAATGRLLGYAHEDGFTDVVAPGDVLAFYGVPKTAGYPHYLDGLPMSAVSPLGYVDRGVGKRGVYTLADDFMAAPALVLIGAQSNAAWGSWRSKQVGDASELLGADYVSGAAKGYADVSDPGNGVILTSATAAVTPRGVPGARLWFSARINVRDAGNNTIPDAAAAVGLEQSGALFNPAHIDTMHSDANHGVPGIYFVKHTGDNDWTFHLVEWTGDAPTSVDIPNVVATALGAALGATQYVPLAVMVDVTGRVIVYCDGNVVGTIAADNPILAKFYASFNVAEDDTTTGVIAPFCAVNAGTNVNGPAFYLDHILVAQETQPDAD